MVKRPIHRLTGNHAKPEIDELADTALFLMSDSARNITAQAIALDGGWTAR